MQSKATDNRIRRRHYGLSLLELLVVVSLMGVFAAAAASRFGRDILGDSGARSGARLMSAAILGAQRSAIRTGDQHGLEFQGPSNAISSWTLVRVATDGSREIIDGPYVLPEDYDITVSSKEVLFDFEGNGTQAFAAELTGPHRAWNVSVAPMTQMIECHEVKK